MAMAGRVSDLMFCGRVGGQRRVPDGREPLEPDREEVDQHDGEHVGRDRQPGHADHDAEPVGDAVRPARGEHGEEDGEHDRPGERVDQQLDGDGQPLAEDRGHVLAAGQRRAQVAVQQAAEPAAVPHPEGLVQVQLDLQLVDLGGRGVGAEQYLSRVAREQVHHHVGQERHAPQHRDRREQAPARQPQGRRAQRPRAMRAPRRFRLVSDGHRHYAAVVLSSSWCKPRPPTGLSAGRPRSATAG